MAEHMDDDAPKNEEPENTAASGEETGGEATGGDLTLPEALLMLALGDEEGKVDIDNTTALPFGLAAAALLTLASRDRLRHADETWTVADGTPTGDAALDPSLSAMAAEENPRGTMHWLRTLPGAGEDDLKTRLLRQLTEKGVLEEEAHRFLWVIPYTRYPTENPVPERRVRERVRQVVLEGRAPDEQTLALIALMDACNLTGEVFTSEEQTEAADRLDALTKEHRVARAVTAVTDETVAAVLVATTAATTAATTTSM